MKIYSDTLTTEDLRDAAREAGVWMAICDPITVRLRKRGWIVSLSGASPYRSQMSGERAATWDQHGVWMDRLFAKDPDARIATYKGRDDFIAQTQERIDWQERAVKEYGAKRELSAPWLATSAR